MTDYGVTDINDFQMVNQSEFADLMGVCVGTVRNWRESGVLQRGKDYLQRGRVIRFPWDREFAKDLMKRLSPMHSPRPKMQSRRQNRRALRLRA
jgi:hypothetical protein